MSQSDNDKEISTKQELQPGSIIEEVKTNNSGEVNFIIYYIRRLLGKGACSKCYECTRLKDNINFALKVIPKRSLIDSIRKKNLEREIKIQKSLNHPKIIKIDHYFEDSKNVYLLLELVHNQTLFELLNRRKRLTELEVQCYIVQLIEVMKYLHNNRIIHRDLNLKNLFLTDKMELKVGDFSLTSKLDFEGERKNTFCRTLNYIAPEILKGVSDSYDDIWSLGVIIYTLIIGTLPFKKKDIKSDYRSIMNNEYSFPENAIISETAKNLISQILVLDPSKRPTLDQILTHDFFHLGNSIPKLLPTSTLTCAPSLSYIRKFMPDAGKDGIVSKPLTATKLIYRSLENYIICPIIIK